jgi:hypothetical protein
MRSRALIRSAGVASLVGLVMGGCGSSNLDGKPDGGGAGGAPPITGTPDPWIYVATDKGVERINAAGGAFQPFGVAAATRSVAVSPGGAYVAQELADQRVAIFDRDGAARTTFDVRTGLLGWSDDSTLLFRDPQTSYLQQASVDGQTRRYLPVPSGLTINIRSFSPQTLSPDRSLVTAIVEPFPVDHVVGPRHLVVLSAADGTLVRDLGAYSGGAVVWTGDSRLFVAPTTGQAFVVMDPRSGMSTPVPATAALASLCGFATWYAAGKILLGTVWFQPGSDAGQCIPSTLLDVDSGDTSTSDVGVPGPLLSMVMSAQSADGRNAAVVVDRRLEVGAVAGGARRQLGLASATIGSVSWAHPTGGLANLVAPPKPPQTALGLAGAPSITGRSGGTDCSTGRWVNRTPDPLPAGWPAPRRDSSAAFDSDRGILRVEGGYTQTAPSMLSVLPILDTQTMAWNGADGQWTNFTRPDGFGPIGDRAMAYDPHRKVVLAMGAVLPGDGTWTWTPADGWKNLRSPAELLLRPRGGNRAESVYDVTRDRWVVSGGGIVSTPWEWDGASWSQSTASPPGQTTPASGSHLVYDTKRARVYLIGNRHQGTAPWLYDSAQTAQDHWIAQPSSGLSPLPRDEAAVAYDARRDRVMVFGGTEVSGTITYVVADMFEWDPETGAWQTCPVNGDAPTPRTNAIVAYDAKRDVLVLFSGRLADHSSSAEVWEWYVP